MFSKAKWKWGIILVFVVFLTIPASVLAFVARGEEEVIIPAGEVVDDDLYATGNRIVIDGTVNGDLVATGSEVIINGTVTGDLLAGAQSIVINGTVGDDVRAGGYLVEVGPAGVVGDDLIVAGYGMVTRPGSTVAGDVLFTGFQALLGGDVNGDVLVFGNSLQIEGRIEGNLEAYLGGNALVFNPLTFMPNVPQIEVVPSGLTLGPNASVGGNLAYSATAATEIPAGSVTGEVTFDQQEVEPASPLFSITDFLLEFFQRFVFTTLAGLLLIWLVPILISRPVQIVREQPWPSLLWGVGTYFLFPLAVLFLIGVSLFIGLLLGLIGLGSLATALILVTIALLGSLLVLFALLLLYVTKVVIGDLTGRAILGRLNLGLAESRVWPMILGVLIIAFLVSIPFLGPVINFVIMLFGLGAVVLMRRTRSAPAGNPPVAEEAASA